MKTLKAALAASLITITLVATGAYAQPQQTSGTSDAGPATQTAPASMTKAQQKAARKAARKEARAKKNAELKKLESAGYKPGGYDPNYPESAQDAQKKAAGQ
jgi:hypothetical protein